MEVHNLDIYGSLRSAGDPGANGQKLYSTGAGTQPDWDNGTVQITWTNNNLQVQVDNASDTETLNLISADANNLAVAGSDGRIYVSGATVANLFSFTSASNTSHVLNHNLNNVFPIITVYNQADNSVIQPATIVSNSANQLTVTFFAARAISGTIVG